MKDPQRAADNALRDFLTCVSEQERMTGHAVIEWDVPNIALTGFL